MTPTHAPTDIERAARLYCASRCLDPHGLVAFDNGTLALCTQPRWISVAGELNDLRHRLAALRDAGFAVP